MREKRKARRIKERAKVTITPLETYDLPAAGKIIRHTTRDISLGGIRIQSNQFLPINSTLKIELSLKSPMRLITAFGKVRWIKSSRNAESFEMGIEFIDTSQEIVQILKSHLEGHGRTNS
jgi:c-di-GMP-binding flagellar brake protein YcgR